MSPLKDTTTASTGDEEHKHEDVPHYENCLCSVIPDLTPLPLESRVPDPSDPVLPGHCIYHHRLETRESETAIFIQMAPEIDELKEVLSTGMVKFTHQNKGSSSGSTVPGAGPSSIALRKPATSTEIHEATSSLKILITERDGLVAELWAVFVRRWGGKVIRRDDGTMFVVDEGSKAREERDGGGDAKDKGRGVDAGDAGDSAGNGGGNGHTEDDPYVKRMREVQAKMEALTGSKGDSEG